VRVLEVRAKLDLFENLTGIKIDVSAKSAEVKACTFYSDYSNYIRCGLHYNSTGLVPPVNLWTWVPVYNIITGAGYGEV
jgi:hypothetical protein